MLKIKTRIFFIILFVFSSALSAAALRPLPTTEDEKENLLPVISYSTKMLLKGCWGAGSTINPLYTHKSTTPFLYALINRPLDCGNLLDLRSFLSTWTAEGLQTECQKANPVIREAPKKFQEALDHLRRDLKTIHTFLMEKSPKSFTKE